MVEGFRVDIFTNLHQDEPVSEPDLLHDQEDILPLGGGGAALENIGSDGTEKKTLQYFKKFLLLTFYLEKIVMILKQKKMLVQLRTRRYQNQRKK